MFALSDIDREGRGSWEKVEEKDIPQGVGRILETLAEGAWHLAIISFRDRDRCNDIVAGARVCLHNKTVSNQNMFNRCTESNGRRQKSTSNHRPHPIPNKK